MKSITQLFLLPACLFSTISLMAQNTLPVKSKNYLELNWKEVATKMPDEWYGSGDAKRVADSVLKYQTAIGGWPKNNNFHKGMNQDEWARIQSSGIGATFDNGATLTEMQFLAKMYSTTKEARYVTAFQKGFAYILKAQYANGGWPQFYPVRSGKSIAYSAHITYNDDAMVHVLKFLKDIIDEQPVYTTMAISPEMKGKAKRAFEKGIDCILKTQIKVNGQPTVWCAQHDEVTLLPANARAYELASYSGSESVGITLLLMDIKSPSKEIIDAVKGTVTWFESHKIEGIQLKEIVNSEGQKDRVVVKDKMAPTLWARFYDLETGEPFFCDRDGIKRKTFAEMGHNRRNGYSWYTNAPEKVLKAYPEWAAKWKVN